MCCHGRHAPRVRTVASQFLLSLLSPRYSCHDNAQRTMRQWARRQCLQVTPLPPARDMNQASDISDHLPSNYKSSESMMIAIGTWCDWPLRSSESSEWWKYDSRLTISLSFGEIPCHHHWNFHHQHLPISSQVTYPSFPIYSIVPIPIPSYPNLKHPSQAPPN